MSLFGDSGLGGALPEQQMYRRAQAPRGRARVAGGLADEGLADLLDCERATHGPVASVVLLGRTDAALALSARGERAEAHRLAADDRAEHVQVG